MGKIFNLLRLTGDIIAIEKLTQENPSKDVNIENIVNEIETNIDLQDIANELNISSEIELVEQAINDGALDEIIRHEDYNLDELDTNISEKDLELER